MEKNDEIFEKGLSEILSNTETAIIPNNIKVCNQNYPKLPAKQKKLPFLCSDIVIRLLAAIAAFTLLFGFSLNIFSR